MNSLSQYIIEKLHLDKDIVVSGISISKIIDVLKDHFKDNSDIEIKHVKADPDDGKNYIKIIADKLSNKFNDLVKIKREAESLLYKEFKIFIHDTDSFIFQSTGTIIIKFNDIVSEKLHLNKNIKKKKKFEDEIGGIINNYLKEKVPRKYEITYNEDDKIKKCYIKFKHYIEDKELSEWCLHITTQIDDESNYIWTTRETDDTQRLIIIGVIHKE